MIQTAMIGLAPRPVALTPETARFQALAFSYAYDLAFEAERYEKGSEDHVGLIARAEFVESAASTPLEKFYDFQEAVAEALDYRLNSLFQRLGEASRAVETYPRARRLAQTIVRVQALKAALDNWSVRQDSAAACFLMEARMAVESRPIGYAGAQQRQRSHERAASQRDPKQFASAFASARAARSRKEAMADYASVVVRAQEAISEFTRHQYLAAFGREESRPVMEFALRRHNRLVALAAAHERRLGLG